MSKKLPWALDESVLHNLLDWGRELEGFTEDHAIDGLTLAQGYVGGVSDGSSIYIEGLGASNGRQLFLIAMDATWLLWLDDCFDSHDSSADTSLDWRQMARTLSRSPTTREIQGFASICSRFAQASTDDAAYQLWFNTAVDVFHAYHQHKLLSQGKIPWSYAEHLQNGEVSVGVMHHITAISLAYHLDMPARMRDPAFVRMLRNLCLAMRLQNDLASFEKERDAGDRGNAVLLMEEFLPTDRAKEFVIAQRRGYERLLDQDLQQLGSMDPFARIARIMLGATEYLYLVPRERYIGGS